MDWKDIPKAMRQANYVTDVPADHLNEWIHDHNTNTLYTMELVPDFQRGHVWTEDQQIKFVESFFSEKAVHCKHIYWNHPQWMRGFEGTMELVDGLQRITAMLRFLGNEIPAFGTLRKNFTGYMPMVSFRMHVNNLRTRKEVLQWYLDINDGGVVHSKDEIDRVKVLLSKEI